MLLVGGAIYVATMRGKPPAGEAPAEEPGVPEARVVSKPPDAD